MLFRRLYDEKTLRLMSRDCLKEEEFLDRNKDLIFEDMEVMTDFELHRFCLTYKVRRRSLLVVVEPEVVDPVLTRLPSLLARSTSTSTRSRTTSGCRRARSRSCKSCCRS